MEGNTGLTRGEIAIIKEAAGDNQTVTVKTAVKACVTITNEIPLDTFIEKYGADIGRLRREMEEHYTNHIHLLFRGKLTKFDKVEAETYEITVG